MPKEADEHERPAEVDEDDLETRDTAAAITAAAGVEVEAEVEVEAVVGGITTMTDAGVDDGDGLAPWTMRPGPGMWPRIQKGKRSPGLM